MRTNNKLKLYVWNNFNPDYTSGLAFAVAASEQEARELVVKRNEREPYQWGDLTVLDIAPVAFCVSGGA